MGSHVLHKNCVIYCIVLYTNMAAMINNVERGEGGGDGPFRENVLMNKLERN